MPDNLALEEELINRKNKAKRKWKAVARKFKHLSESEIDGQLNLPGNERKAKKFLKLMAKRKKKIELRTGTYFGIKIYIWCHN